MKIIFLDIDGVLNSNASHHYWKQRGYLTNLEEAKHLCPVAISNLNLLMKENQDLKICLSSAWRKVFGMNETKRVLHLMGFKYIEKLVSQTLQTFGSRPRGHEVQEWLEDHPGFENFIVLDDKPYNFTSVGYKKFDPSIEDITEEMISEGRQFIWIDHRDGFTYKCAEAVHCFLNRQPKRLGDIVLF